MKKQNQYAKFELYESDRYPYVIVVNRHRVKANRKSKIKEPVFRISRGKHGKPQYSNSVYFNVSGKLCYEPDAPLPCGAQIWFETFSFTADAGLKL